LWIVTDRKGSAMADEQQNQRVVAIDIGGTGLKGAVINRHGHVIVQENRPTLRERGGEAITTSVLNFASDLSKKSQQAPGNGRVVGVGIAVPGVIDETRGVVLAAVNLQWKNLPLSQLLTDRLGVRAVVGHDARAAGIAEGLMGAAQGSDDFFFVAIGTGIGAASVLHGKPYVGVHHMSGEFGHTVVQPNGPLCPCGRRGCIETLASASAVVRRYRELSLTEHHEDLTTIDVVERVVAGDRIARLVWDAAIEALSIGLANYVHLFDPERIIIGGGLAEAGQVLFDPLIASLAKEVTLETVPPPVFPAALGNDAGYMGAALKAWITLGVPREELHWRDEYHQE
jgi:glucokinase